MVAVEITEDGVEFSPLVNVRVHPAAELFPMLEGEQFADLVKDIREHGLHEPIAFTPDGYLLDGRNRYRACKKIRDEEPTTRVEHSEPYAYVISTNLRRRHLSDNQRKMIGGRIAERTKGQYSRKSNSEKPGFAPPPTQKQAAELLNVPRDGIERARKVVKHGIKALQHAVDGDEIPLTTAARISDFSPEDQQVAVDRIKAGARPSHVAPLNAREPQEDLRPAVQKHRNNISPNRHKYVSSLAIERLIDVLEGLDLVLNTATDGLDPSVTHEEAARLSDGLSKARGSYRRVLALLTERIKEHQS